MTLNQLLDIAAPATVVSLGLIGQALADPDSIGKMVRDYGWFAPIVGGVIWAITLIANRVTKYIDSTDICLNKLTEASVAKTELIRALAASQKTMEDRQILANEKLSNIVTRLDDRDKK